MSDRIAAIVQSNYIPWKGYFDLINTADQFVLLDDVQYTRRDWRNRNKIKTPRGLQWLSIPVDVKGKYEQKIKDTKIADSSWAENHWRTLQLNYGKAPYFKEYADHVEGWYRAAGKLDSLSEVNHAFLTNICDLLGIKTSFSWAMDYDTPAEKTDRLLSICLQLQASTYLSGPAAKDYLDEAKFADHGIAVKWMDYGGYPEYEQLHGEFEHGVSILDLLFSAGPSSKQYMKSFRNAE